MADSISFRHRNRGVCVAEDVGSIQAVSIAEPRVKFVKGWLTGGSDPADGSVECGGGTAYPIQVTVDQLSEIMYRVRDCEFTTGGLVVNFPFDDGEGGMTDNYNTSTFNFSSLPSALVVGDGSDLLMRAYCTSLQGYDLGVDPDPMEDYGSHYFGESYLVAGGSGFDAIVREAENESALWAGVEISPGVRDIGTYDFYHPFGGFVVLPEPDGLAFRTGFDYLSNNAFGSSTAGFPLQSSEYTFASTGEAYVNFTGVVAWLDDDSSGNPLSPGNRLFVEMTFALAGDPVIISTRSEKLTVSGTTPTLTGSDFELELAGSVVISCPLYYYTQYTPGADSLVSATNFRLTATEWWPYKNNSGDPVWDSATGEPL